MRTIRRFVTATTISALIAAGLVSVPLAAHAAGTTYYVSSSGGSDTNPGTSSAAPWQTLNALNARTFEPGDHILLKRGDTWTGTSLTFTESGGEGAPITLSAYGAGNAPMIAPGTVDSWGVRLDGVGHWRVNNLAVSNTREGVVLTYNDVSNKRDIVIDSMQITDLTSAYNSKYLLYNHTSAGISVKTYQSTDDGSASNKPNPPNRRTALTGLTVTDSTFNNVGAATWFGGLIVNPSTGFQSGSHQWTRDVTMSNLEVNNGALWGFNVLFVDGGSFANLRAFNTGAAANPYGTAGLVVAYANNVAFDRVHIRDVVRHPNVAFDGAGFDFEGVGNNVSLTNSTVDLTDGAGIMTTVNSNLPMTDINVENVEISRWARNPGSASSLNQAGIRVDGAGGSGQFAGIKFSDAYNRPASAGNLSAYRTVDISETNVPPTYVAPAPAVLTPPTAPAAFSYGTLPGTRNDVTHQVGTKFTVSTSRQVYGLGRYWVSGNYRPHSVALYRDSDKALIARCVVQPATPTASDGIKYCTLSSPVTLSAGSYWLLSAETAGGDAWHENAAITPLSGITVNGAGSFNGSFNVWATGSRGYGPVSLK